MSIPQEARLLHKADPLENSKFLILDSWGKEMRYSRNGPGGGRQIESAGPDGIYNNSDDVNSNN